MKSCLKIFVIAAILMPLLFMNVSCNSRQKASAKVTEYIAKGDYDKAREYAAKGLYDDMARVDEAQINDLVEKGDFVTARKIAKESEHISKVVKAQVSDLISKGNFDMASQIAKEENFYVHYYDGVVDHLTQIYEEQGESKLLYALSIMTFPVNECHRGDGYVGGVIEHRDQYYSNLPETWGCYGKYCSKYNADELIERSNLNIETFCDYLTLNDNKPLIPKVLTFLRPIWLPDEKKYDTEKGCEVIIKKRNYDDYTEVKRIKAKFGVK